MFGKNSAGKSSIISSLLLLKQSAFSGDDDALLRPKTERGPVDLGSIRELMYGHDVSLPLRISFSCLVDHRTRHRGVAGYPGTLMRRRQEAAATYDYGWTLSSANDTEELQLLELHVAKEKVFRAQFDAYAMADDGDSGEANDQNDRHVCYRTSPSQFWMSTSAVRKGGDLLRQHAQSIRERLNQKPTPEHAFRTIVRLRQRAGDHSGGNFEIESAIQKLRSESDRLDDQGYCEALYLEDQSRSSLNFGGLFPLQRYAQNPIPRLYDLLEFRSLGIPGPREHGGRAVGWFHNGLLDLAAETVVAANVTRNMLQSVVSIGPVRERPSRLYIFSGTTPTDVGHDGRRVPDLLFRDDRLLARANEWLVRLEVPYEIVPQRLIPVGSDAPTANAGVFELRLRDLAHPDGPLVSMSDVGFGVSQILPIIAQILLSQNNLITVEQPELHIHPGLQAKLADLFIAGTKPPHNHQFLIETHSEHFALRLQKRLSEKDRLTPEDVNFLFVRRTGDGSKVVHIPLDSEGQLTEKPPGGFFLDRLSEL